MKKLHSRRKMNKQDGENEGRHAASAAESEGADSQAQMADGYRPPRSTVASGESSSAQIHGHEQQSYPKGTPLRRSSTADSATHGGGIERYQVQTHELEPLHTETPHRGRGKHPEGQAPGSPTSLQPSTFETTSYSRRMSAVAEYEKLATTNRRQHDFIRQLQDELRVEKAQVHGLEDEIREQARVIDKVHSNAIGRLSHDVSSSLPDDKIRRELHTLFDGRTRDWCMEFYAPEGIDGTSAAEVLLSNNILAGDPGVPEHLKINIQDEAAAPVLLQAALAKTLCDLFLTEPFFLQEWLPRSSDAVFQGTNLAAMTDWRVHTVNFLETEFPPSRAFFEGRANYFVEKYACLRPKITQDSLTELTDLMERFGMLAIQLWKRHVLISVEGLEQPDLRHFHSSQPDMEAEDSILRGAGRARLDGRPVQVMVRPRIVSQLVQQGGQLADRVVWSKAVVWVSNAK